MKSNPSSFSILVCLALLFSAGCATDGDGSRGRPSVTIYGQKLDAIRGATIQVFQDRQFELTSATRNELVFLCKGSAWDNAVHGTWMDEGIWERVRIQIEPDEAGVWTVVAQATMVRDPDGGFFEEEKPLSRLGHKPFQNLLEEVKARLL